MHEPTTASYQFGPFRLEPAEHLLRRAGAAVPLTPKAFQLLLTLVEQHGRLLSKDELLRRVWPDVVVEEANLTSNISQVRKALGDGENGTRYIETVPKRGYRFVAEVRTGGKESKEQDNRAILSAPLHSRVAVSPRRALAGSTVLLVLVLPLTYFWWQRSATSAPLRSLAILPFKSLQANSNNDYLGLGLADTLITKLGGLRQLIVRPTSAIRKYDHPEQDPLVAGREQQVDAVLDASLQRQGDRVRVTVRLLNVSDGTTLWSYQCAEQYCADLFLMQDTISEKVAAALTSELTGTERARLRKRYTENRAAYELYLKGRFFAEKRTGESLQMAESYYRQALAIDPNYALVYVGLADIYFYTIGATSSLTERERLAKAKASAERALALDASLSEAHTMRARMLWKQELNWAEAKRELERAIELDPNSAFAHRIYGDYLSSLGRHEEAIAEGRLSQRLEPLSLAVNYALAVKLYFAERSEEALAILREVQKLDPNFAESHQVIGMVYAQQGKYAEAIAELEKGLPLSAMNAPVTKFLIGYNYALWGKREEAIKLLEEVKELARQGRILPHELAEFYTALGEKEQAFALLQRSCQEPNRYTVYLKIDPKLKPLRSDPRFAEIVRCIGLPP